MQAFACENQGYREYRKQRPIPQRLMAKQLADQQLNEDLDQTHLELERGGRTRGRKYH